MHEHIAREESHCRPIVARKTMKVRFDSCEAYDTSEPYSTEHCEGEYGESTFCPNYLELRVGEVRGSVASEDITL